MAGVIIGAWLNCPASTPITDQAVRFARFLRGEGISVSPAQTLDFVQSLTWIDIADRSSVRDAARAIFVTEAG